MATSDPTPYINAVYYPSWKVYRNHRPSDIIAQSITHIYYAFARPQPDGSITVSTSPPPPKHALSPNPKQTQLLDPHADLHIPVDGTQGTLAACTQLRQNHPHIKIILSIGGASGSAPYPALTHHPESRQRFAASALALLQRHRLNGIDIDWEHPQTAQQGADFLSLLRTLRAHLPRPHLLTTALPVGEYVLKHIDLSALGTLVDHVNLMAYDFSGPWTAQSGHHAQLFAPTSPHNAFARRAGASAVAYFIARGVAARKLVLGVPTYARWFRGCRGVGEVFSKAGEMDVKDVPEGVEEVVDRELVAASCRIGEDWVSCENRETVGMKAAYVRSSGLGGVFFWTSAADRSGDEESLVGAAARGLYGFS